MAHSARGVGGQGFAQGEGDVQGRVAQVVQQKALPQGAGLFPVTAHSKKMSSNRSPEGAGLFPALTHSQKSVS